MKCSQAEMLSVVLLFLALLFTNACYCAELPNRESEIIAKCLDRYGGLTPENAERLQRYKSWSDTYEEIPCFTNCYIAQMFDFYSESQGFDNDRVIKYFGSTLHNACRQRLTSGRNSCDVAFNGFHCLVKLEDDPNILIESMPNISAEAKTAMKECLHRFDRFEWDRIKDYSEFPVREPIPCFTKCYLDKLQAIDEKTKKWNDHVLHNKLGLPASVTQTQNCNALLRRRSRNTCHWMYQEFICFTLAKKGQLTANN